MGPHSLARGGDCPALPSPFFWPSAVAARRVRSILIGPGKRAMIAGIAYWLLSMVIARPVAVTAKA